MKKLIYILLACFLVLGCTKETVENEPIDGMEDEPIEIETNLPPNSFNLNIENITHDSATVSWNAAIDPENDDVTYTVYLNETVLVENLTSLTYQFTELSELTNYSGKIVAVDTKDNESVKSFSFKTEKYFLKFLKSYDYGEWQCFTGFASGTPYSIIKASDSNYVITGASGRPDCNASQFFVMKIDYQGELLWKRFFDFYIGGASKFKIIESNDGGFLIAHKQVVIKLDKDGNESWNSVINSYNEIDGGTKINSIDQDAEGNIYLVGERSATETNIRQEAALTKLDNLGNIIFDRAFKNSKRSAFYDIEITELDEIIILGTIETSVDIEEEIDYNNNSDQIDYWMLKTDTSGDVIWENIYGDERYDFATKLILKSNGNYAFGGFSWGAYDISTGRILEINPDGDVVLDITTSLSTIYSIAETLDNGFIATGHQEFGSFGALGLYKFNSIGDEEWNKNYEEPSTHLRGRSVIVEDDGGYRIAASSARNFYNEDQIPSLLVYKTDPEGNFD